MLQNCRLVWYQVRQLSHSLRYSERPGSGDQYGETEFFKCTNFYGCLRTRLNFSQSPLCEKYYLFIL